jgi:hypothetical protein
MDWIQKNFRTIIYISFLVPILLVAFVSISHVTTWYGLANPMSWAVYLSVGIEIAALSALAAISAQMGSRVYLSFGIVTLIQFIGNIFFAYQFIDTNSEQFKDWVDLVDPIVSYLGVESGNIISHKRFLALFSGGMLPIISLSFLHMLVKFEEEDKKKRKEQTTPVSIDELNIEELSREVAKKEAQEVEEKYTPTEEELKKLEEQLIKINELKFGKLVENNSEDQKIEVTIEETKIDEKILPEIEINEVEENVLTNQEPLNEEIEIEEIIYEINNVEENDLINQESVNIEDIIITEEPKVEDTIVETDKLEENVLISQEGVNIENIVITEEPKIEDTINEIEIEPDFYKEDEADYSLDNEKKTNNNYKTLRYFRPH